MDVNDESGNGHSAFFSDPPRVLLALAAAALALGVGAGLAYYGAMIFDDGIGPGGWGIASTTFYLINSAVYAPALLLGLLALLLVRSDGTRDRAARMTRPVMVAAALLLVVGLAQVVVLVGQVLSDESTMMSGWFVASQALAFLASALYESGVLLVLVYIFRQQEKKYAAELLSGEDLSGKEERAGR
jgi:hypothetical protein